MKRLILHIGMHKTGTTAIQSMLKENADLLQEQGFYFPVYSKITGGPSQGRNANFLHSLALNRSRGGGMPRDKAQEIEETIEQFVEQIHVNDTLLMSDESIWKSLCVFDGYLSNLLEVINSCGIEQVSFILYIRRQDEFIESFWRQCVKGFHERQAFDSYIRKHKKEISRYLNYAEGISKLAQAVGEDNITVRVYEKNKLVKGDARWDFADAVGFNITEEFLFPEESSDPRVNKGNISLSNNLTEIMRIANMSPTFREDFSLEFIKIARTATVLSNEPDGKSGILDYKNRVAFLDDYKEGNAYLAKKYFARDDGNLFDSPNPDDSVWHLDSLGLQRDAILFLMELISVERAKRKRAEERLSKARKEIKELKTTTKAMKNDVEMLKDRTSKATWRARGLSACSGLLLRLRGGMRFVQKRLNNGTM